MGNFGRYTATIVATVMIVFVLATCAVETVPERERVVWGYGPAWVPGHFVGGHYWVPGHWR